MFRDFSFEPKEDIWEFVDEDQISEARAEEIESGPEITVQERDWLIERVAGRLLDWETARAWFVVREITDTRGQRAFVALLLYGNDPEDRHFVQVQSSYEGARMELPELGFLGYQDFEERRARIDSDVES